jgi:serine/threonine-protein phosphatase 6 regulatory ankyrin repeat subunit B
MNIKNFLYQFDINNDHIDKYHVYINKHDKYDCTPLIHATINGYFEIIQYLVENGADINIENYNGWTALMCASSHNYLEVIKYLVENGAKIDIQNNDGWTALMWASKWGYLKIIQYLVENGADIYIKNKEDKTALDIARIEGNYEIVQYLDMITNKNNDFQTPELLVNAFNQYKKSLITKKEFLNHITKNTLTLDICKEWVDSGGDVNIQNEYGWSALLWASRLGHLEIVQCYITTSTMIGHGL